MIQLTKICTSCGCEKPLSRFYNKDLVRSKCISCTRKGWTYKSGKWIKSKIIHCVKCSKEIEEGPPNKKVCNDCWFEWYVSKLFKYQGIVPTHKMVKQKVLQIKLKRLINEKQRQINAL